MNKTDFISLIENPEKLGKTNISALKNIAADFPYFQSAQLLLTKAYFNEKHYEFEKQLKYASIMLPDRNVLFKYIHNIAQHRQQPVPVLDLDEPIVAEHSIENISIETAQLTIEEPKEDKITEPILTLDNTHNQIIVAVETNSETTLPDSETIELSQTDQPILSETHSFTEWLQLQQQLFSSKILLPEEKTPQPITESTLDVNEELETQTVIVPQPQKPTPIIPSIEPQTIQQEIAQQIERSNVNEFESILDKFIRENPRMSRGKAEFYNPVNMAKQSVEADDELVTETLAAVYYKQGHYKKAIKAYQKLCLVYPHKITYFAALIQKIKTENKE